MRETWDDRTGGRRHGIAPPSQSADHRFGRREWVRLALATLAGVAGGPACLASASGAQPQRANGVITLTFVPWTDYFNQTVHDLFVHYLDPFIARHRGVRVNVSLASITPAYLISAILAGEGPDVWNDWQLSQFIQGGYLLPLDEYIRRDNIDTSIYVPTQFARMHTPEGTFGLPNVGGGEAILVNFDLIDQLGLKRPTPDWSYTDMEHLARATMGSVSGKWRYGIDNIYPRQLIYKGFGGSYVNEVLGTRCTLDTPAAIAAAEWVFGMMRDRVATNVYLGPAAFSQGQTALHVDGVWNLPPVVEGVRGIEWDFLPFPNWPKGQASYSQSNGYLVNARTRWPELAWELMKFLCVETQWQRSMAKMLLLGPSITSLWDEWLTTVAATVPPLRNKSLHVFRDMCISGTAYPHQPFRYNSVQAYALIGGYYAKVLGATSAVYPYGYAPVPGPARMSVSEALTAAARTVNAYEAAQAAVAASQARAVAQLDRLLGTAEHSSNPVQFPPPSRTGAGKPPRPAARGAVVARGGVYTLTGSGSGLRGTEDGFTFACMPWTRSRGTFTCRLASIANVSMPQLNPGGKVGLMARGDLSDEAPLASIEISLDRGLHSMVRPQPAMAMADQRAGSLPGLVAAADILHPSASKQANYLLRPVWLRLVQDVNVWTAYTSFDGRTWRVASSAMALQAAGVWVGVFVTPKDPVGHAIRGTFDHLSFNPTDDVQVG